jgi:hypothetical protein
LRDDGLYAKTMATIRGPWTASEGDLAAFLVAWRMNGLVWAGSRLSHAF